MVQILNSLHDLLRIVAYPCSQPPLTPAHTHAQTCHGCSCCKQEPWESLDQPSNCDPELHPCPQFPSQQPVGPPWDRPEIRLHPHLQHLSLVYSTLLIVIPHLHPANQLSTPFGFFSTEHIVSTPGLLEALGSMPGTLSFPESAYWLPFQPWNLSLIIPQRVSLACSGHSVDRVFLACLELNTHFFTHNTWTPCFFLSQMFYLLLFACFLPL